MFDAVDHLLKQVTGFRLGRLCGLFLHRCCCGRNRLLESGQFLGEILLCGGDEEVTLLRTHGLALLRGGLARRGLRQHGPDAACDALGHRFLPEGGVDLGRVCLRGSCVAVHLVRERLEVRLQQVLDFHGEVEA